MHYQRKPAVPANCTLPQDGFTVGGDAPLALRLFALRPSNGTSHVAHLPYLAANSCNPSQQSHNSGEAIVHTLHPAALATISA
eukprot:9222091-Pyramimonas_sp.AAC.1